MDEQIRLTDKTCNWYWSMIKDKLRNQFFYNALMKHARDKVVFDMGCGTGILSSYALSAGAKHVYAIDEKKDCCEVTRQVLQNSFDDSRFTVIHDKFAPGVDLSAIKYPIDILVSETVGPGLFDQGMIQSWDLIKSFLAPNAISIPDSLSCDLWVWKKPIDSDTLYKHNLVGLTLTLDECVDTFFWQAMKKINRQPDLKKMHWMPVNDLVDKANYKPDVVHTNKVVHTMDNLPETTDGRLDISFRFEIETPASVAVINKISFESDTLYLKDAPYSPWKYAPMFNLEVPATYEMIYNNFPLRHMPDEEWKVLQKVPSSIG